MRRMIKDLLFGKQVYYYDPRMKPEWTEGLYTVDIYSCRRNGKSFWEDPKTGEIHWETVPEHEATHRGWVVTKGHIKDISFPVTLWVARYKTGHLVAFTHKPEQRGMYWVDDHGPAITLPRTYYPEVKFSTGPKEVTYIQSV